MKTNNKMENNYNNVVYGSIGLDLLVNVLFTTLAYMHGANVYSTVYCQFIFVITIHTCKKMVRMDNCFIVEYSILLCFIHLIVGL